MALDNRMRLLQMMMQAQSEEPQESELVKVLGQLGETPAPEEPQAPQTQPEQPRPEKPEYGSRAVMRAGPGSRFVEGMMKRGWTREEAAGLAGNVQIESAFRPDVKSSVPKEQSYGLMQWNKDRLTGLKNMAAQTKRDWRDPEVQMDWINMERSGESVKYGGSNERGFYNKALAGGGTAEQYAERFGRFVERPKRLEDTLKQRQQYARQFMAGEDITAAPSPAFDDQAQVTPTTGSPQPAKTTTPTTTGAKLFQGEVYPAQGFVFHHSGGSNLKGLVDTLQKRKLGSQYLMDRDGTIYSFAGSGSPHIKPNDQYGGVARGLSNANAVGMEIVAKDDSDITPAQVESARRFIAQNYPGTPVYGHGEVNPGHKQATEGLTVAKAIRDERDRKVTFGETLDQVHNMNPWQVLQSIEG